MKTSSQKSVPRMVTFFNLLGRCIIDMVNKLGAATIFFSKAFVMIFRPRQLPEIIEQVYHIGATSSAKGGGYEEEPFRIMAHHFPHLSRSRILDWAVGYAKRTS